MAGPQLSGAEREENYQGQGCRRELLVTCVMAVDESEGSATLQNPRNYLLNVKTVSKMYQCWHLSQFRYSSAWFLSLKT